MSLNDRSQGLMLSVEIMGSEIFRSFVQAENNLIAFVESLVGKEQEPWHLEEALDDLGRCINKSLTFKLIPRQAAKKN